MKKYQIEDGIPIPKKFPANTKYQFGDMKVNQCIFIPLVDAPTARIRNAVANYAKKWAMKFTVREEKGGCRVWRTE